MKNNLSKKAFQSFSAFVKSLGIIILCLGITLLITWPLWKFATSASAIYTKTVLICSAMLIIMLIIKKIIKNAKK